MPNNCSESVCLQRDYDSNKELMEQQNRALIKMFLFLFYPNTVTDTWFFYCLYPQQKEFDINQKISLWYFNFCMELLRSLLWNFYRNIYEAWSLFWFICRLLTVWLTHMSQRCRSSKITLWSFLDLNSGEIYSFCCPEHPHSAEENPVFSDIDESMAGLWFVNIDCREVEGSQMSNNFDLERGRCMHTHCMAINAWQAVWLSAEKSWVPSFSVTPPIPPTESPVWHKSIP